MRYLLDTNVISEIYKQEPNQKVLDWMKKHDSESYLSCISVKELWFCAISCKSQKFKDLYIEICKEILNQYKKNIVNFDSESAQAAAEIELALLNAGKICDFEDRMIAAIAKTNNMTVATRNTKHFQNMNVDLVNPFE